MSAAIGDVEGVEDGTHRGGVPSVEPGELPERAERRERKLGRSLERLARDPDDDGLALALPTEDVEVDAALGGSGVDGAHATSSRTSAGSNAGSSVRSDHGESPPPGSNIEKRERDVRRLRPENLRLRHVRELSARDVDPIRVTLVRPPDGEPVEPERVVPLGRVVAERSRRSGDFASAERDQEPVAEPLQ